MDRSQSKIITYETFVKDSRLISNFDLLKENYLMPKHHFCRTQGMCMSNMSYLLHLVDTQRM